MISCYNSPKREKVRFFSFFNFFIVAMEEPSQLNRAIIDSSAGAISGGISRTVTSPLDVIKIRFQVRFYFYLVHCFILVMFMLLTFTITGST